MLVERAKLKTFLAGVGGGLVLLCAGVLAGRSPTAPPPPQAALPAPPAPSPPAAPPPVSAAHEPPRGGDGLREAERAAMAWRGKSLGRSKGTDVTSDAPYKITVVQDPGHATVNRLRIDLDRDDKWDEKWDFDGEGVRRQVAPGDDEQYTQTFAWSGNGWVAAD